VSAVSFNDNLGVGRGSGLLGFARTAFWYYCRHDSIECKPGMWLVKLHGGSAMGEFWTMVSKAHCVVDDFGNLVRVQ
jgi:hypothetical protein